MTPTQLLALYLAVGAGVAAIVLRRSDAPLGLRLASACAAWALWPLWAPIALSQDRPVRVGARSPAIARLHAALDETLAAAAGTPFEALLGSDAGERIRGEIERAVARIAQLGDALGRPGFDPDAAGARLAELERSGASARAISTARLHRDGVARLARLRDADRRAIGELADALEALRSQIVLAQVAGPVSGDIVSDLWARVEGLGAALDADDETLSEPEAISTGTEARA